MQNWIRTANGLEVLQLQSYETLKKPINAIECMCATRGLWAMWYRLLAEKSISELGFFFLVLRNGTKTKIERNQKFPS